MKLLLALALLWFASELGYLATTEMLLPWE